MPTAPSRTRARPGSSPGAPPRPRSCARSPSPGASSSTSSRTRSRSPPPSARSPSEAGRPRASSRCATRALVWKLRQSPRVSALYCAPGNAGIAEEAECVPIAADDVKGLLRFAEERHIDLTVVGPELPLTLGLVDRLTAAGLTAFGPTAAAARLEGSKEIGRAHV